MMQLNAATVRQNQAAEPQSSTWLSANAGSGKTRVLTDRVARLLLDKVQPQNILCLTYTKAAASEMQNRLFQRLGSWAMKPDADLAAELEGLGVAGVDDSERLAEARRLFARAIETPGGLRIQTIHSFCASLLRRFPLEAGVTPNFSEMDDRAAALLRDEVIEELADGGDIPAIDAIAAFVSGEDALESLTRGIVRHREVLQRDISADQILGWFELPADYSRDETLEEVFDGSEADLFGTLIPVLRASDKVTDQRAADRLQGFNWASPGVDALEGLIKLVLFGEKAKVSFGAKIGSFPTKASQDALGEFCEPLNDLMLRVEAVRERLFGIYAAEKTKALYQFANAFLPAYEARKLQRGWLDFDDLIARTRGLLSNDAVASWVLYRLDGGLDHILVDEAQDTSPAQWQVIKQLAQEFTSGLGARDDVHRTIFVVGDKKQSIYSFQGADPREFDRMQEHFGARLAAMGDQLRPMDLEYSFRSSDAILRFVDNAVEITSTRHRAFRDELPGRVDLWPPVPVTEKPEKRHWYDPVDIQAENHQSVILARAIAKRIDEMVGTETIPLPNGEKRLISAGDILILVRRRSDLFAEIIRACKARKLPIAGADRLKLGAELAVKDIAALLSFLATAEDSLSLASILRSPLFGWSEGDLFDLAAGRAEPYLWAALRGKAELYPETYAILRDLRDNADFLRPHDLIERILTRHDGRRKLLARLGPEAEDGLDVLLAQSLAYERSEVPSLTGFLTWLETDDVEVKRQMDNAGDLIRVMTVHGAKGLEAPVVILPDTAKRTLQIRDEIVPLEGGELIWKMPTGRQPEAMKSALSRLKSAQKAEEERLFYVAVTRAETWLIVVAAGEVGGAGESWHQVAEAGLKTLGATILDTPTGAGLRYAHLDWGAGSLQKKTEAAAISVALPGWAREKVIAVERPAPTRAPSGLGGAKALGGAGALNEEAALRHGRMVHRLLEFLPDFAPLNWSDYAERLLGSGTDIATRDELRAALGEARAVIESPDFAALFGDDVLSEVDISANLPELGGERIAGTIDKLIITPDRVLAVDYKTNAVVPNSPQQVPDGILRQVGAYHSALEQIYPDRQIETAILWTRTPHLMHLPHEIVRQALCNTATS